MDVYGVTAGLSPTCKSEELFTANTTALPVSNGSLFSLAQPCHTPSLRDLTSSPGLKRKVKKGLVT